MIPTMPRCLRSVAPSRGLSTAVPATTFDAHFSGVLVDCKAEVAAYGACMSSKLGALDKGVCAKEFQALKACSEATLRRQRGEAGKK